MGTVTRQRDVPFVPAHARYFCDHCGYPFRGGQRTPSLCQQYVLPGHGRCGRRLRDARDLEGLKMRLKKAQEADPYVWRTSEDAIAHGWVSRQFPDVNHEKWQPALWS
jgi:hypothetical protein